VPVEIIEYPFKRAIQQYQQDAEAHDDHDSEKVEVLHLASGLHELVGALVAKNIERFPAEGCAVAG
jgi:hypothetical protein